MNNDLISRNHAIEMLEYEKEHIDSEERKSGIDNAIEWIKVLYPANAVLLDKLCEWLGEQGMLAPCYFDQTCVECELKTYWQHKKSECWKHVLTKWMEEQNDGRSDQPERGD